MLQIFPVNRPHLFYEEVVERRHVRIGQLAVRRKGHCRIEPVTILGDALPDRAIEILETVAADAGFGIGRNVG